MNNLLVHFSFSYHHFTDFCTLSGTLPLLSYLPFPFPSHSHGLYTPISIIIAFAQTSYHQRCPRLVGGSLSMSLKEFMNRPPWWWSQEEGFGRKKGGRVRHTNLLHPGLAALDAQLDRREARDITQWDVQHGSSWGHCLGELSCWKTRSAAYGCTLGQGLDLVGAPVSLCIRNKKYHTKIWERSVRKTKALASLNNFTRFTCVFTFVRAFEYKYSTDVRILVSEVACIHDRKGGSC